MNKKRINIGLAIILNLVDFIFTYVGLKIGYFEEANQFLNMLYQTNELLFIGFKLIFVTIAMLAIGRHYDSKPWIKYAVGFVNVVYLLVFVTHIIYLFMILTM